MAKRKISQKTIAPRSWQENYASLIFGAIIVVIIGLLVANFLTRKTGEIGDNNGDESAQSQEQAAKMQEEKEYTVVSGDSLSKIAQAQYGSMDLWQALARANNIQNPNIISVNSKLKLPAKEEIEKVQVQTTQTSYEVKAGDTLFKVAEAMYGDGSKWNLIDRANNIGRLPNGNPLIFAGSTLSIPR